MSAASFQFKQFTVFHDRCAMKVGTDAVLLGAWADVDGVHRILDVGTGSGIVVLMLAQRTSSDVWLSAVEIDEDATNQAKENVAQSPWKERVEVTCCDFCSYHPSEKFDLIVSNPPYFVHSLPAPDSRRAMARHSEESGLNYDTLLRKAASMLSDKGRVVLIFPSEVQIVVESAAAKQGLFPHRILKVFTKEGNPCKRVIVEFSWSKEPSLEESLIIQGDNGYSESFKKLTKDFYLKL